MRQMNAMPSRKQGGFTLIELVMVIVLVGVLAAVAVPRFMNTGSDARAASASGLAGGLRSAVGIVQSGWVSSGSSASTVTMLNGVTVAVSATTGLPTAAATGIGSAMQDLSAYTATYSTGTATFLVGNMANCGATYTSSTGTVTVTTTGC